jgi:hypothetical protein
MKYHKGQCENCRNARDKSRPLPHVFLCFADTGRKWVDCSLVSKSVIAKNHCRYMHNLSAEERAALEA